VIWEKLIEFIFAGVTWLLEALPDFSPSAIEDGHSALRLMFGTLRVFQVWLNLPVIFGVLALAAGIELALVTAQAVQWAYSKIPLKST
jgi:hypothetical protein